MKTIEEIKHEVALELQYNDWDDLVKNHSLSENDIEHLVNKVVDHVTKNKNNKN